MPSANLIRGVVVTNLHSAPQGHIQDLANNHVTAARGILFGQWASPDPIFDFVDDCDSAGITPYLNVQPDWDEPNPLAPAHLQKMKDFSEYCVQQDVPWGLFNEANADIWFKGSVSDAAVLWREVVDHVGSTPIGPHISYKTHNALSWLDSFLGLLKGYGNEYLPPVVAAHFYDWPEQRGQGVLVPYVEEIIQILGSHGIGDRDIWFTELGPPDSGLPYSQQIRQEHLIEIFCTLHGGQPTYQVMGFFPYHSHTPSEWVIEPSSLGSVYGNIMSIC